MNRISVILKPTDACNIRCKHCYNSEKKYGLKKLSIESTNFIMDKLFREFKEVNIIWHGGEPLLMGKKYFENIVQSQKKLSKKYGCKYKNSIQTNGILLDDDYLDFFTANKFTIGISFDGPVNNILRQETEKVEANLDRMILRGDDFGVLSVICNDSIDSLKQIYEYFVKKGVKGVQIEKIFDSGEASKNSQLLVDIDIVTQKFTELFTYYLFDKNCKTHITNFDVILHALSGLGRIRCDMSSCLYKWVAIENNGDIYPCARFYSEEYKLGNIFDMEFVKDIFFFETYNTLVKKAITRRNKCMTKCKIYHFCNGGCNNQAIIDGDVTSPGGYGCTFFKRLFTYVFSTITELSVDDLNRINPILYDEVKHIIMEKTYEAKQVYSNGSL